MSALAFNFVCALIGFVVGFVLCALFVVGAIPIDEDGSDQ